MKSSRAIFLLLLVAVLPPLAAEEREPPKEEEVGAAERDRAIAKAFAYLDRRLFAMRDASGTPTKPFTVAVAGLDYLLAGKARRGTDPVPKILSYLERYVDGVERRYRDPDLIPATHSDADSEHLTQVNWPLAQTAIFLVELSARGRFRERARRSLKKIVTLLEAAQEQDGGWGHERLGSKPKPAEPSRPGRIVLSGYPRTLLATTNTVAAGLGIARAHLGEKSVRGLDAAIAHYRRARLENGNCPYDIRQRSANETGVGRTAGALVALYWLGVPKEDPDFRGSADFVLARLPMIAEGHGSPALNMMHGAFATRLLGDDEFRRFRREYFRRILEKQGEDGSLACVCRGRVFGVTCDSRPLIPDSAFEDDERTYVTALHLFVLLMDRSKLSLMKEKPRKAVPKPETTPK